VRQALSAPVTRITDAVKETLEQTPPELAADISRRGIALAGGGALLRRLAQHLRRETQLPVQLVDDPLTCVAVGAGRCLDQLEVIAHAAKITQRRTR